MSTSPIIATHRLDNGLDLTFLDQSKQIAADRWYVCVTVQISIPVEKKWFDSQAVDDLKLADMKQVLGNMVLFEQKKERNFVSADIKDDMIKAMCEHTMQTAGAYLGHADFAAKYILIRYNERMRQF